jgi:hypothetical protein
LSQYPVDMHRREAAATVWFCRSGNWKLLSSTRPRCASFDRKRRMKNAMRGAAI